MGFLDRLLGREPRGPQQSYGQQQQSYGQQQPQSYAGGPAPAPAGASGLFESSEDQRAVARYRYLLRTAAPEQLEQVHAEAFGRLTSGQRQQVLTEMSQRLPTGEPLPSADDPQAMARTATRAEMRQPGYLEQTFSRGRFGGGMGGMGMGGMGMGGGIMGSMGMGGMGMGGGIMGSMMGTMAGVVIGSVVANELFAGFDQSPEAQQAADVGQSGSGQDQSGSGQGQSGSGEQPGDPGATDTGYSDVASDGQGYTDAGSADSGFFDGGGGSGFDGGGGGNDFGGF